MVEAEVSTLLASWLTPTSLFVLLNIVLGTVLLANNRHSKDNNHHQNDNVSSTQQPQQYGRAPSFLNRVTSFNFSSHFFSDEQHHAPHTDEDAVALPRAATAPHHSDEVDPTTVDTVPRSRSLLYRVASFKFSWTPPQLNNDHCEGSIKGNDVDEKTSCDESHVTREKQQEVAKVKKVKKKKVNKEIVKEKETTSLKKGGGDDEEVDAKADDFINKFKQHLKMQRLESLRRFRST